MRLPQIHCTQTILKVKVLVTQSCLTLCDSMDCSPPGSSVHGILQARILQWVAVSFSRGPGERLPSPSLSKHLHSWPQSFLCKIMIGIILLLFSRGKIKSFHLSLTKWSFFLINLWVLCKYATHIFSYIFFDFVYSYNFSFYHSEVTPHWFETQL